MAGGTFLYVGSPDTIAHTSHSTTYTLHTRYVTGEKEQLFGLRYSLLPHTSPLRCSEGCSSVWREGPSSMWAH